MYIFSSDFFVEIYCLKEYYEATTLYNFCMRDWYVKGISLPALFVPFLCFEAEHVHSCVVRASARVIGLILQASAVQINK